MHEYRHGRGHRRIDGLGKVCGAHGRRRLGLRRGRLELGTGREVGRRRRGHLKGWNARRGRRGRDGLRGERRRGRNVLEKRRWRGDAAVVGRGPVVVQGDVSGPRRGRRRDGELLRLRCKRVRLIVHRLTLVDELWRAFRNSGQNVGVGGGRRRG